MDTQHKNQEDHRPKIENHMENCNVFMGDSYGGIFPLPGAQVTIHQHLDPKMMKKGEGRQMDGKTESQEDREKRKDTVMKAITGKFCFTDEQLGRDNKGRRITNMRLADLFRQCFGLGHVPPSAANRAIMEQLWVLLIDERNQCPKDAGLGFIPQTVLNIIGHFAKRGLVSGQRRELARAVIKNADTNIAKNIDRGLQSNVFPQGTADMIDHYIDKLMKGED